MDYPAYPSLTATPAQPAQSGSHSQYGAAQNHTGSYGSSHGSYAHDYGNHGKQQQAQEYSASPYQPHGQPHPTATTALQGSSTLLPLARPHMMRALMGTSRRPRPLSSTRSMLSMRSRRTSSPACRAGSSCRQTMARRTTTTLPQASRSGRGQQDLHEACLLMHNP